MFAGHCVAFRSNRAPIWNGKWVSGVVAHRPSTVMFACAPFRLCFFFFGDRSTANSCESDRKQNWILSNRATISSEFAKQLRNRRKMNFQGQRIVSRHCCANFADRSILNRDCVAPVRVFEGDASRHSRLRDAYYVDATTCFDDMENKHILYFCMLQRSLDQ